MLKEYVKSRRMKAAYVILQNRVLVNIEYAFYAARDSVYEFFSPGYRAGKSEKFEPELRQMFRFDKPYKNKKPAVAQNGEYERRAERVNKLADEIHDAPAPKGKNKD